ncbi:MAG: hypothetical protein IPK84_03460 [Candidatus Moraniibacteriota bacterium]|nr:MAG: hypothetical protein IPK84_03460 [Candidatus Moranbacteria bacterium]
MKVELEQGDFFDANFQRYGICFGLVLSNKIGDDLQACALSVGNDSVVISLANLPDDPMPLREERVPLECLKLLRAAQSAWGIGLQYPIFFGVGKSEANNDSS